MIGVSYFIKYGSACPDNLSLGFNAGATTGGGGEGSSWPPRNLNYGIPSEMGMPLVGPNTSFNHQQQNDNSSLNLEASAADPIDSSTATTLGVGVIPLLTAAPHQNMEDQNFLNGRNKFGGIQFWQNQHNQSSANLLHYAGGHSLAGSSGGTPCQDCGNQAKKDCRHGRCRTCCKSRGFDCSTHVRSTWVPAARRRERQLAAAAGGGGGSGAACSSGSTSGVKKPRLITQANSHTATSKSPQRSMETSYSNQGFDENFKDGLPGKVQAPAVFKYVKVMTVDEGEDEYAYQAVVRIGGHIFKGFLYDQGAENRESFPNMSNLQLGGSDGGGVRNGTSATSPIMLPNDVYGVSGGGGLFGASSGYGNPMNLN